MEASRSLSKYRMRSISDDHLCCPTCQRSFTRIDHLKRHQLRHSGLKPYSCVFCNELFTRCDNLRIHYPSCAKRGDREIPETAQRGRRRHACQSCTLTKLRCDGKNPCGTCRRRNIECVIQRKQQTKNSFSNGLAARLEVAPDSSLSTKREDEEQPLDRGSIKFLLNAGTDSFIEKFHLPPRSDRTRGLVYHNRHDLEDVPDAGFSYDKGDAQASATSAFFGWDLATLSFFQDTFINFFHGPFGESGKSTEHPYLPGATYDNPIVQWGLGSNLALPGENPRDEPEKPFAAGLIQSILTRAWAVPLDPKGRDELTTNLAFLLTTMRIRKFVTLYFRYWHPNGPMIHPQSFDMETVPLPLLASVVFMGAFYSRDEKETQVAKRLLDFAELFVFSSDVFSYEAEIGAVFTHHTWDFNEDIGNWNRFQNFQAGFIMIILQYWAGSRASRNRAMESRFSELIKVARRIKLLSCRHQLRDQTEETLWIQEESKIRTISIILLLDCAFSFFQNFPCRLAHTEMKFELPCEERLFNSEHPFAEPTFRFSRDVEFYEAFQSFFEQSPRRKPCAYCFNLNDPGLMGLTVLDMFILIHVLYVFINTHMTLLVPLMQDSKSQSQSESHTHRKLEQQQSFKTILEDTTLSAFRTALSCWRGVWVALRSQVSCNEWVSMGFYKNGYNFWLVSQLLITKKHSVDVMMRMEVKCEDKLRGLDVLLQED